MEADVSQMELDADPPAPPPAVTGEPMIVGPQKAPPGGPLDELDELPSTLDAMETDQLEHSATKRLRVSPTHGRRSGIVGTGMGRWLVRMVANGLTFVHISVQFSSVQSLMSVIGGEDKQTDG